MNAEHPVRVLTGLTTIALIAGVWGISVPPAAGQPTAKISTAAPMAQGRPYIKLSAATISDSGRTVRANVRWHRATLKQDGHHRLVVRLVATSASGASTVLRTERFAASGAAGAAKIRIRLPKAKAELLRQAGGARLVASQRLTSAQGSKTYVSSLPLPIAPNAGDAVDNTRDCSGIALIPGADLSNCQFLGADLRAAQLSGATMTGANLTEADLSGANLSGADLTGVTWWNTKCPNSMVTTGSPCGVSTFVAESGFVDVPAIKYNFAQGATKRSFQTTPAKLWYTFYPARSSTGATPLFVMLNGGPGAATTANLFANNTAPFTLSPDWQQAGSPGFSVNPYSWDQAGNLLYIDPAQTGFSYNVNPGATVNDLARYADYFLKGNFNPFIDADQVLRVVLDFLDSHEKLRNVPVVFVAESYGGVRVSTMLNMLLNSQRYTSSGSGIFHDDALVAKIRGHFTAIGQPGPLTPSVVASQFGRQILIQPQISSYQGDAQTAYFWKTNPGVMDDIAAATGHPGDFTRNGAYCNVNLLPANGVCATMAYVPSWGRDRYNWAKPANWTDDSELAVTRQLTQLGKLNAILGTDVTKIKDLQASGRRFTAYHYLGSPLKTVQQDPDGELAAPWMPSEASAQYQASVLAQDPLDDSLARAMGRLSSNDTYYMAWNKEVYIASALNKVASEFDLFPIGADTAPTYGEMFLENARSVRTFLTDAYYDLVIYSDALPLALRHHTSTVRDVTQSHGTEQQLGTFDIHYTDGATVSLYYPYYAHSGHAVAASEPEKILADVGNWLSCTSAGSC